MIGVGPVAGWKTGVKHLFLERKETEISKVSILYLLMYSTLLRIKRFALINWNADLS